MLVNSKDILNVYKYGYCDFDFPTVILSDINKATFDFDIAKKILIKKVCSILEKLPTPILVPLSGRAHSNSMLSMIRGCFTSKDIKLLTIGYDMSAYDEIEINKDAILVKIYKSFINEVLGKITKETYKNVFSTSSLIPTYAAINRAKELGNSIVTGDGGDEIFCGYDKYLLPYFKYNKENRRLNKLRNYIINGYSAAISNPIDSVFPFEYLLDEINSSELNKLEKLMLFDRVTELVKLEIPKVETAVRMAGVKNIVSPFLVNSISNFVTSLPTKYKYRMGVRKRILRSILKDEGVKVSHRKKGFSVPIQEWVGGELNWTSIVLDTLFKKEIIKFKE